MNWTESFTSTYNDQHRHETISWFVFIFIVATRFSMKVKRWRFHSILPSSGMYLSQGFPIVILLRVVSHDLPGNPRDVLQTFSFSFPTRKLSFDKPQFLFYLKWNYFST